MTKAATALQVPLAHGFWLPLSWQRMRKRARVTGRAPIVAEKLARHLTQRLFLFRRQFCIRKSTARIRRRRVFMLFASASAIFATTPAAAALPTVRLGPHLYVG